MSSEHFLNHEVRDGHEEKQEEMPGTTGTDFYDTSVSFALFVTFVVIPGLRQKLSERDNPDAFFILIPETIETFWLLSLNGICAFFLNRQGRHGKTKKLFFAFFASLR